MSVKGRIAVLTAIAGLTLAFAAGPAFARDETPRVLQGEVVAIHNAQEGNGEGFHEITILTAEQEQVRLKLGPMNTPPARATWEIRFRSAWWRTAWPARTNSWSAR